LLADAGTSTGRLMLAVLGRLADVERDLIRTRTAEGRSRAKQAQQAWGGKAQRLPPLTVVCVKGCGPKMMASNDTSCLRLLRPFRFLSPLTRLRRLAAATHPLDRVHPANRTATKGRIRPLGRVLDQPCFTGLK
jgi:hypothetical protein